MFEVGFRTTGKDDLAKAIGPQISQIAQEINRAFTAPAGRGLKAEIIAATREANILQNALKKATSDKGISFVSLNSELRKAGTSAEQMVTTLGKAGPAFSQSFNVALTALATADRRVITISERIREMQRVMTQSIKFTAAQNIQRQVMSAMAQSIGWVKDLNRALTEISVVTGKTGEDLDRVYESAVRGSRELRVAADEYAKGALIFYQQGLKDEEVKRRTDITIKSAKAAGQSIQEMSSQLTSIWNNYRMIGEEQERAASVGAALAAKTAVDFKDIATAMQTAAAPAAQMGVEYNQLAAIIATVGDVSQQSASTIGNAYKTIFSRFQQLRAEGTDGEVTLSSVSSQLKGLGINVLDQAGNLRELGTVINEVGENWNNWTQTQQTAIAQIVGGTRQYGQFLTLMQNFDKYQKNLQVANNEDGSELEGQYGRALESIESKAENAGEAWKRAFGGVFDEDLIKKFYEVIEDIGNAVDGVFSAFDDWKGILTIIVALVARQLVPSLLNGAKTLKDTFKNITPEQRQSNREREANQTRESSLRGALKNTSGDANRIISEGLEGLQGKNIDERRAGLQDISKQLEGQKGISRELQRQIELQMKKASIQENIGNMASKIEELERIGTQEAKSKAEMLRAQLESYSATMFSLADQTTELQRQSELYNSLLQGSENSINDDAVISNDLDMLVTRIEETQKKVQELRTQYDGLWDGSNPNATSYDEFKLLDDLNQAEGALKDLQDQRDKLFTGLKRQMAGTDIGRDVARLGEVIGKNLMDILDDGEDVGRKMMDKILEGFEEDSGELGNAVRRQFENLDTEDIALDDISNVLNQALGEAFTGGEIPEDIRNRVAQIQELLHSAGGAENQGSNIFDSINEQVDQFSVGLDGAITAATNLASAATLAATGIKAMGKAMEEGDPLAFAAGLGTAATGVIQFVGALPQAKAGFTALGGSLSKLGTSIAGVIPGLEGVASSGAAAAAAGTSCAAAAAVAAAAIAAVVAVVAALVFAWQEYQNAKPEAKLKRAEEAAQELTKAEEDAKIAADELRDTFESYKTAEEALEGCKRGTEEWEQALRKVNEAALAVVDALPSDINFADAYSRDADGRIRLNGDAVKAGQDALDYQSQVASYTAASSRVQASMARNDLAAANLGSAISDAQYVYSDTGGTDFGQTQETVARLLTESAESFKDLSVNDIEGLRKALEDAGVEVQNLSDSEIQGFSQKIIDLGNSTEAAREKMDLIAKLAVDEQLDGKNFDNDVKDLTGERIAAKTKDLTDKYLGALTNGEEGSKDWKDKYGNIRKTDSKIDDDLLADYNKLTGKNLESSGNGVQGTDTNRIFEFIDEQGNTIKKSAKQMAEEMAAAEALLNVEGAAADISKDFDILNRVIEDSAQQGSPNSLNNGAMKAQGLKDFLVNKNMNSLTDSQLTAMAGMDSGQIEEMVKTMFNLDDAGLKEWVQGYGYDTVEAFTEGLKDGVDASQTASAHAADNLSSSTKKMFDSIANDGNLTVEAKENLAKALGQAFDNFDKEAAQNFSNAVDAMGKDADTFLTNINEIDWDSASPENLKEKLKKLGIQSNLTDDQLEDLIEAMRGVGDASLDAAQSYIANLNDAVSGIDGNNSIISDEDFNKLKEAGINADAFFQDMGDGTHQLMEDADAFKQLVHDVGMGKLQEAKDNAMGNMGNLRQAQLSVEGIGKDDGLDEARMMNALYQTGSISNTKREEWLDRGGTSDAEVAEEVRQAYADAGISAEKIDQMMLEAADEAERAQQAMDNSEFQFEVESAGLDLDETTRYAERLAKQMAKSKGETLSTEEAMKKYGKAAQQQAINNQKLDRGLSNLNKNLKDYKKALTDSNKGTAEWSNAMNSLKADLADIVGFDDADLLSDTFAQDTLAGKDLELALNGDIEAIQRLQTAAADDMIINVVANQSDDPESIKSMWTQLKTDFENFDLTAPGVDQTELINSFNQMIADGKMTKDQIEAALAGLHVSANVKTDYIEQDTTVPTTITEQTRYVTGYDDVDWVQADGSVKKQKVARWRTETNTFEGPPKTVKGYVPQYTIEGTEGEGGVKSAFVPAPPAPSSGKTGFTPGGGRSSGGGGSGGSKSSTPVKKVQKTEKKDKERYTDNENAVEDVTKAVDRLSKANDHAFGPQKIRNLNLMNIQLAKQAKAYQGLYNEAKMYTKLDAMSLVEGLNEFNQKYGTTLQAVFDGDDLLDNQMEIMNIITDLQNAKIDEINAVENEINALAAMNVANDDPRVTALTDKLEVLKESLSEIDTDVESMVRKNLDNYQEAIRKAEETMQAMVDILHQGLANEIEKYTLARDLHIKINDLEREHWEAIMDNMGEVGKLGKQTADMLSKSLGSLGNSVDHYVKHYGQMEDVQKRWENRDITLKAEYGITDEVWDRAQESGMIPQEIMDAFEGDIDALMSLRQEVWNNLDKQWQNYIDTIQHYIDEYDRITDKLDRQASISDNLLSLIDTVGFNYKWGADEDSASFKNMNAQMDIVRNKAKAVNGELEVATNRRIEAERELNNLLAGRTAKEFADNASEAEMFEYDRIKAHYDEMADLEADLNEQRISLLNEAYEKATEYAEKWGEVLAHESEKALNAMFSSYDQAMDMYNQKRDIDTFFMDEEDKVFELNKLQREINKTIEDASDPEMLSRYNELLKEIDEKKQAGVKMTEKDLEILQAQFDLEQARDAYEDARNAKNTMRLARDASGNWSYVYSADNSQTEDQAAAIEEKLHNIRKLNKDAADEYSETWLQLQVDWDNYIKSIDKARFEQEEEYRKEVEQRNNWYAEQSNLLSGEIIKHNDAIDRSFADTTLGVIINFGDMAQANETYKDNHNQLREKLRENYQSWIDKANETKDEVGGSMKDLEEVVNEETGKMMDEVEQLDIQIDTLNADAQSALGQLEGYISGWVDTVNREFQTTIDQIDALIDAYLKMLEVMAQQADANAGDPNYEYNAELNSAGLSYNRLREIKKNSSSYEEFLEKAQNDKDLQYWAWNGVQKGEQMSGQGHAGADYWKDKYGGDVDKALDSMIDHIWNEAADKINHKSEETDKSQQAINSNNKYRAATGGLFEHHAVTEIAENGPEIVLNKQDTENILKAVSMMREAVGRQMGAKSLALDSQVANASASASDYTPAAQEMQFDQNVKIEAVFPGVSAAGEIEQALNSIITQAAQYRIKK